MMNRLCKSLLEEQAVNLIDNIDPGKVANELVKGETFERSDFDAVMMGQKVRRAQNQAMVDIIQTRGRRGLSEFIRSLTSVDDEHRALAEKIQPVNYRILWISTCPSHAASVVHILDGKFSKMKRIGNDHSLILRRGRIFRKDFTEKELKDMKGKEVEMAKRFHEVEVCLVFPAVDKEGLSSMFEEVFKNKLVGNVNLVVLGKTSDLDGVGNACYVISDTVMVDGDEMLQRGPTKEILPQVWDIENVEKAVMHSKSYRKSRDSDVRTEPETEVLDFDSMVLSFYAMCSCYDSTKSVPSLACVNAVASVSASDQVDVTNTRVLKNVVRCYYRHASQDAR